MRVWAREYGIEGDLGASDAVKELTGVRMEASTHVRLDVCVRGQVRMVLAGPWRKRHSEGADGCERGGWRTRMTGRVRA